MSDYTKLSPEELEALALRGDPMAAEQLAQTADGSAEGWMRVGAVFDKLCWYTRAQECWEMALRAGDADADVRAAVQWALRASSSAPTDSEAQLQLQSPDAGAWTCLMIWRTASLDAGLRRFALERGAAAPSAGGESCARELVQVRREENAEAQRAVDLQRVEAEQSAACKRKWFANSRIKGIIWTVVFCVVGQVGLLLYGSTLEHIAEGKSRAAIEETEEKNTLDPGSYYGEYTDEYGCVYRAALTLDAPRDDQMPATLVLRQYDDGASIYDTLTGEADASFTEVSHMDLSSDRRDTGFLIEKQGNTLVLTNTYRRNEPTTTLTLGDAQAGVAFTQPSAGDAGDLTMRVPVALGGNVHIVTTASPETIALSDGKQHRSGIFVTGCDTGGEETFVEYALDGTETSLSLRGDILAGEEEEGGCEIYLDGVQVPSDRLQDSGDGYVLELAGARRLKLVLRGSPVWEKNTWAFADLYIT